MADENADLEQIEALADLLNAKGLTEIEYERRGLRIRVARGGAAAAGDAPVALPATLPEQLAASGGEAAAAGDEAQAIVSPMVGTFYVASSPESPPFVEIGDRVRKGQTVCIIEAMKLMNEIESEYDGVVAERMVDNAQGVEFGQPLFRIEVRGNAA